MRTTPQDIQYQQLQTFAQQYYIQIAMGCGEQLATIVKFAIKGVGVAYYCFSFIHFYS